MELDLNSVQEERSLLRKAVLLAKTRYDQQYAPFVRNSVHRLSYVDDDIHRLCVECANEVGAPIDIVERHVRNMIRESISAPTGQDDGISFDSLAGILGMTPQEVATLVQQQGIPYKTDLYSGGAISRQYVHLLLPYAKKPSQTSASYAVTEPTRELVEDFDTVIKETDSVDIIGIVSDDVKSSQAVCDDIEPDASIDLNDTTLKSSRCVRCNGNTGGVVCASCNDFLLKKAQEDGREKKKDKLDKTPSIPDDLDVSGPVEAFEEVISDLANIEAAIAWSEPGDQDYFDIAEKYGLSESDVRDNLVIKAEFGGFVAINGDLVEEEDEPLEDMELLTDFGGRVPATESYGDVSVAVDIVANDLNMEYDDVFDAVDDAYNKELGEKYYVSVSGETEYYLPKYLVSSEEVETSSEGEELEEDQTERVSKKLSLREWFEDQERRLSLF